MSFIASFLLLSAFNVLYSQTISGGGTGPYPKLDSSSSFVLDGQEFGELAIVDYSQRIIRSASGNDMKSMFLEENHPYNNLMVRNNEELLFHPYNSHLADFEFTNNNLINMESIRDAFGDRNIAPHLLSAPINQIKSVRLEDGTVLEIDILLNMIQSTMNETLFYDGKVYENLSDTHSFHLKNDWEKSKIPEIFNSRMVFPQQTEMPWDSFATTRRSSENGNVENKINNPIADYEDYINALREFHGMEELEDINIYSQYLHLNKDRMQIESLKNLYDYWNTDLYSPSGFTRYQHNPGSEFSPAQNLDWMMAQEDIQNAVNQWMDYEQTGDDSNDWRWENQTDAAYVFQNKVYLNPYRMDVSEILLNDGTVFDMKNAKSLIGRNRHFPSMVDLPWDRIESVILQDGLEISLEEIRELSSRPESVSLNEIFDNY